MEMETERKTEVERQLLKIIIIIITFHPVCRCSINGS